MKKLARRVLISALLVFLFFVVSGYLLSDAFFFKRLVYRNSITSPERAFDFVAGNTGAADWRDLLRGNVTSLEYSPRKMLTEQKHLFCDQSAILMLTIVGELGNETRLVDWVGDDGVSCHTTLEVEQGGAWKTYDPWSRKQGETYEQIRSGLRCNGRPVYRPYVGERRITRNNYYVQRLASWLRRARNG